MDVLFFKRKSTQAELTIYQAVYRLTLFVTNRYSKKLPEWNKQYI